MHQSPGCRLKPHSKWSSSGRQLPVSQRLSAVLACASALGKRQQMTTQIRNCRSPKFALCLNTGSGNLTTVNKIAALIGHRACAAWKNSVGSWRHCAAELAKVDARLSGRDSGAACVNTPVLLAAHRCCAALV